MLVASVLAAVLLAAVLAVTAGMGRERQRLAAAGEAAARPGRPEPLLDLLRRDLANADTIAPTADGRGVHLVGHGGLDARSLAPTGRLTRVTYRVRVDLPAGGGGTGRPCLVREQRTLDDRVRPDVWAEVVAVGVRRLMVGDPAAVPEAADDPGADVPETGAGPTGERASPVSRRTRVRIEFESGVIDQVLSVP
jgi:hypothetical protein